MTDAQKIEIEKKVEDIYKMARKEMDQGSIAGFRSCIGKIDGIGEAVKILAPDYRLVEFSYGNYGIVEEYRASFECLKVVEIKGNFYYN